MHRIARVTSLPWLAASVLALIVAAAPPAGRAQDPVRGAQDGPRDEKLAAEITVFESQLVIDPTDLSLTQRQRVRPEGVVVLEDGAPRRVTNIQPLGTGEWKILIYVDAALSRPKTVRLASLRLGSEARRLTDLGTVEIVVADPDPQVLLAPGRDPVRVADKLAQLAESGVGSDELESLRSAFGDTGAALSPGDPERMRSLQRELELVRARVDHLLLRAAQGCEGAPCMLLLVSDGFHEDPARFYLGEGRLADHVEAQPALDASRELAQTVAGYEWLAFPLPLRENRLETPIVGKPRSDFEVFLDHTGAIRRAPRAEDKEPNLRLEALEVSVTPILQPLQRLAVDTAGHVVRVADDLATPLDALEGRRRVYYLTDRPLDGEVRSLSARLVETGTELHSPAWIRSSTPPAVAAARVRALLATRPAAGATTPLEASIERGTDGQATLVLEADWGAAAELTARSMIRVSVGYERAGELPWVGHQRLAVGAVDPDGAWRHRLTVPLPDGVGRVAVVAEALVPRVWGATLVDR
jgi:hypothetical protein